MKKYLLITCLTAFTFHFSFAGENKKNNQQQHSGNTAFGTDVIIKNDAGLDQTLVKLTTAFNGWQYAAFNTVDIGNNMGGITLRVSKDAGLTWKTIDSYLIPATRYPSFDIVVAGTDTNNLTLFNVGVNENYTTGYYTLFIDQYNGATGSYLGNSYQLQNTEGPISDVSIASDYAIPGLGASPYSVGILYSTSSFLADSVIFLGSVDGGATWGANQAVQTTVNYFGKVSIAYGHSSSASNGRYFGAWEMLNSLGDRTGGIYTSRSISAVNSGWITPICLDSVTPSQAGLYSNPSIAVTISNADNDSASVTADILVDLDYYGDASDYDVVGFYNKRAHFTDFWYHHDIISTSEMDKQPDIAYCIATSAFMCTYFDSTEKLLPYLVNDANLVYPDSWIYIANQYNDAVTGLNNPQPQISVNQSLNMAAFAWIQNNGSNDVALFDAEGATVSVPTHEKAFSDMLLYPNPAAHDINVSVSLKSPSHIRVDVFNALGQLMLSEDLGTFNSGRSNQLINVESLANGNYFIKVTGDRFVNTEKMVIEK